MTEIRHPPREPIAIVGIGCRLPGGIRGPGSFWSLLMAAEDAISEIPADRWSVDRFFHPTAGHPGTSTSKWGGFVAGIDLFEPECFAISPREAALIDPQQRWLLETSWEALADAGVPVSGLAGSKTGVFVGISTNDYAGFQTNPFRRRPTHPHTATGGTASIAANRISYCFDLSGPSVAVDTACSSSLVALHLAVQSLRRGECRQALVGGVNALITPNPFICFSAASMLSPDGRCKAFDASADGFVRSEGAAVVVLKPLSEALADGDRIYASIQGTACNHDGRTSGISAPSVEAQAALVRTACEDAGVEPHRLVYVEAHGTGTAIGDPVEAEALGTVLGEGRGEGADCLLGSVKTNIGHLEAGAGMTGLIKAALVLSNRTVPPNLHFHRPNPKIDFASLRLEVPVEAVALADEPLFAGVNSFGFGGANAHVVLASRPPVVAPVEARSDQGRDHLFLLSGRTPEALVELAEVQADWLKVEPPPLAAICHTAGARRNHERHRLATVVSNTAELALNLQRFASGEAAGVRQGQTAGDPAGIVFVFGGQGPQWWGMGRELLDSEPVYRATFERCDHLIRHYGGWSLIAELERGEEKSRVLETTCGQPAICALQIALADLWRSWGIQPAAVVGHSVGEIAAAHVSGALSLDQAMQVVVSRGRSMDRTSSRGRMVAVGCTVAEAEALVAEWAGEVVVAAHNGPSSVTLSGPAAAIEALTVELQQRDLWHKMLSVDYGFHSPLLDPVKVDLLATLADLAPSSTSVSMVSTVTGSTVTGTELGADYWWSNVRGRVRFADATAQLLEQGLTMFVELGPHPVLAAALGESLSEAGLDGQVLASLRRDRDQRHQMLETLGGLTCLGHEPDWSSLCGEGSAFVSLPPHPWAHRSFWSEAAELRELRCGRASHPMLDRRLDQVEPTWLLGIDPGRLPYLRDHRVSGALLLPAAALLEVGLAVLQAESPGRTLILDDVEFRRALVVPEIGGDLEVRASLGGSDGAFAVISSPVEERSWTIHAAGRARTDLAVGGQSVDLGSLVATAGEPKDPAAGWRRLQAVGLDHGPCFRGLTGLWLQEDVVVARVELPEGPSMDGGGYFLHPALLDACLQAVEAALPTGGSGTLFLPSRVRRLSWFEAPGSRVWARVRLESRSTRSFRARFEIWNDRGEPVAEIEGFECQAADMLGRGHGDEVDLYLDRWQSLAIPGRPPAAVQLPAPQQLIDIMTKEGDRALDRRGGGGRMAAAYSGLDDVAAAYVARLVIADGRAGDEIDFESICQRLAVGPSHHQQLRRLLFHLERQGLISVVAEGRWRLESIPDRDPRALWREALMAQPAYLAEATLVGRCGEALEDLLAGRADVLELLFPDGGVTSVVHLYRDAPSLAPYNAMMASAVARMVADLPEGSSFEVLEVGAGTGGLTTWLWPLLPEDRSTYHVTDVAPSLVAGIERELGERRHLRYSVLDLEKSTEEQGFTAAGFHLIVAANVLHGCRDLRFAVAEIERLLAPGGALLALETGPEASVWLDLVFGFTNGWWRFEDLDRRHHPMVPAEVWSEVAREVGLEAYAEATLDLAEGVARQRVFTVRKPDQEVPAAISESAPDGGGSWLLLADSGGVGRELAEQMAWAGAPVRLVDRDQAAAGMVEDPVAVFRDLVEAVADRERPLQGVVHLWALDSVDDPAQVESLLAETAALVKAVDGQLANADPPRLLVATRRAQPVGLDEEPLNPILAPMVGFMRVVANEHPLLRATTVDLPGGDTVAEASFLALELGHEGDDREIVIRRGGARFVPRLDRLAVEDLSAAPTEGDFRVQAAPSGVVDRMSIRSHALAPPGPGQVAIQVEAAALNFRDVLKALGFAAAAGDEDATLLGDECSGRVVAVGEGVTSVEVGDDVVAIGPACLGSTVVTRQELVLPRPTGLTHEEACTIPITFLTADRALRHLARLEAGERVLVHSATGGVGLAAVQIARRLGAVVLATAGSADKRQVLELAGVEHVFDSRSLSFADEVLEQTDGRGVDVVLNALAGRAIERGLACLAPFGRFVEIGKRDIYDNTSVGLWPFRRNLSFFALDLAALVQDHPSELRRMWLELHRSFVDGSLRPLPHRVYPVARVVEAFRAMSQALHVGKVVISMADGPLKTETPAPDATVFRDRGTYLITGGCGGFGLALARWIVERGGRHLALVGRRGDADPEAKRTVAELRMAGAEVEVYCTDVADGSAMEKLMAAVARQQPPLAGVFHLAMVLDDGLVVQLDRARIERVMAPKVRGAYHLDRLTRNLNLDHFVLFSSVSSVIGNHGQGSYGAANAYLDALAHQRRSLGRPGLTINWGQLAEVGAVARDRDIEASLLRRGVTGISTTSAFEALDALLQGQRPQVAAMNVDWRRMAAAAAGSALPARLSEQVTSPESISGHDPDRGDMRRRLEGADEPEALLAEMLTQAVAAVVGEAADAIEVERPLNELGMDSLMVFELKNRVESDFGVRLSTGAFLHDPSIAGLARSLLRQLLPAAADDGGGASVVVADADSLVTLRPGGSETPLYCLHPSGGELSVYRELVAALPSQIPVIGLQSRLLAGFSSEHPTIAAMADHYAELIRSSTPSGPIHLFGFSFGGLVAAAVAAKLETLGRPPAFVGIVNSDARWADEQYPQALAITDMVVQLHGLVDRTLGILSPLPEDEVTSRAEALAEEVLSLNGDARIDALVAWLAEQGAAAAEIPRQQVEDYMRRTEFHTNLIPTFEARLIKAPLRLWSSAPEWQRLAPSKASSREAWSRIAIGSMSSSTLEGDHYGVLARPAVERLAAELVAEIRTRADPGHEN